MLAGPSVCAESSPLFWIVGYQVMVTGGMKLYEVCGLSVIDDLATWVTSGVSREKRQNRRALGDAIDLRRVRRYDVESKILELIYNVSQSCPEFSVCCIPVSLFVSVTSNFMTPVQGGIFIQLTH